MQSFNPVLETRILKTILDGKNTKLLNVLTNDWFGLPVAREIWLRVAALRANGKAVPTSLTLSEDPILSEKAQTLLRGDLTAFDTPEVEEAQTQLDYFRKGRLLADMLKNVAAACSQESADLSKAKVEIDKCLSGLQNSDFEDEVLSYGVNNDKTLEFYEQAMAKNPDERFIQSGFKIIDEQQGGLGRGRLYTLGAPSGGGKSLLANDIGIRVYRNGHSVCYASFELNREECLFRTQANITKVPHDKFQLKKLTAPEKKKSDQVLAKFLAQGEAKGVRLDYLCPKKDINIADLFSSIEHLKYDVVVIDYINLMAPVNPKETLWWNIGEGFRLAKRFAERTNCAVIMLVQIDEETGNIKYAKSIKHHSDGVWIWDWEEGQKENGIVKVEQVKLRNFKPIEFRLKAEFEYCAYVESFGMGAGDPPMAASLEPMKFT